MRVITGQFLMELLLLCVGVFVQEAGAQDEAFYGLEISALAYQVVCWYESLRQFPNSNAQGFQECTGNGYGMKMMAEAEGEGEDGLEEFGPSMASNAMPYLPPEYGAACNQYLIEYHMKYPMYEGDALNDNFPGTYPWQGYAYCMMNVLRQKFGNEAIEAVKAEKTQGSKPWMQTIFDRDNQFRARHGADPFVLNDELSLAAQQWAGHLAVHCTAIPSDAQSPSRQWNGDIMGESFYAAPGLIETTSMADSAYFASDAWYEQMKYYPFPEGYQGDGEDDPLFEQFRHFTQTVWSDTKYVGYGYAYNGDCDPGRNQPNWYIVARYSPGGNQIDQFKSGVLPPKF